jgi:glyoxylase-like metal-dependent hydrolase (beta-lactamase superfamily II)
MDAEGGAMGHHHHHDDGHGHHGRHGHRSIRLASPVGLGWLQRPVHRVGRRQFLTELGRGTFAVAILGGVAAACSNDSSTTATTAFGAGATDPPGTDPAVVADGPATTASTTSPVEDGGEETAATDAVADELRWSQVALGNVSAYVLVRGNEAAVVDTGNPGSADQIGEALGTLSTDYDDVRHVVLTHHHPDHIGSLPDVLGRAASAAVYAGAADIPNISAPVEISAVGDGDDVFGLQVIETPGHTPGSISVLDTGIGLLVAGDAMNGNADGTGISGANERFTADMTMAGESIRKLAGFEFDTAAFGHGNPVVGGAGELVEALVETL